MPDDIKFVDCKVTKYGRKGKPHSRTLYLHMPQDGGHPRLVWCKHGARSKHRVSDLNSVQVRDVADIRRGKDTDVFMRRVADDTDDDSCLSIITARRTLDLECENKEQRDKLADSLADLYEKVTGTKLLLGIRVRRDSTYKHRLEFEDKVATSLRQLHAENRKIWDKSMFHEAPYHNVDKDFPRLAKNFVVFHVYPVQQDGSQAAIQEHPQEDEDSDSDTEAQSGQREKKTKKDDDTIAIDTLSMVPNLGQAYETRRLDTCDYDLDATHNCRTVMASFACLLLDDQPAGELMEDFIERTEACLDETKKVDIQRIIREFLEKHFTGAAEMEPTSDGNNKKAFLALLKVCNQNIIFPSVFLLKQTVLDPFRARDLHEKGGWDIVVSFHPKHVYITHSRREISDVGRFTYQWTLTLTFDFPSFDLIDSSLQVTELRFQSDCPDHVRHDLSTKLFQVNRIGAMIQRERLEEAEKEEEMLRKGSVRKGSERNLNGTASTGSLRSGSSRKLEGFGSNSKVS